MDCASKVISVTFPYTPLQTAPPTKLCQWRMGGLGLAGCNSFHPIHPKPDSVAASYMVSLPGSQQVTHTSSSKPWNHSQWHEMVAAEAIIFFNTLRLRQNGRHFTDETFNRIFLKENVRISIKISLKFVRKSPIDDIPALFQIMAWHRPGDKPLSEAMMVILLMHIWVVRPQWVKILAILQTWWCYDMEMMSTLLALCEGNPVDSPHKLEFWCFLCCQQKNIRVVDDF